MIEFAKIYEEWNNYYGYNFDELAHDSLEDVKATLVVYNAIKKKLPSYVWMSTQLLIKEKEVIFESDDVTEVIDKAKELIDILAPGGQYIFALDKNLLKARDINPENLKAVLNFVKEYGKY